MKLRHLMFFLLLVAFAASGCIFSPEEGNDPGNEQPPPTCETAETADDVMTVFREVYAGRQLDCYRELLSKEYVFVKKDGTYDNFDTEMVIANKMFNGIAGESDYIISDITIDVLEPQGVWLDTPANDPDFGGFPESQFRPYEVHMEFLISGHNLTLIVTGTVVFYVMDEGVDSPDFKILGQSDHTIGN